MWVEEVIFITGQWGKKRRGWGEIDNENEVEIFVSGGR